MRLLRPLTIALISLFVLIALLSGAWAAFGRPNGTHVAPNLYLGGKPIGGASTTELDAALTSMSESYATAPILIGEGKQSFTTAAAAIRLSVDVNRTRANVLEVGRVRSPAIRITDWAKSLVSKRRAVVALALDDSALRSVVAASDPGPRTNATEPSLSVKDGQLQVIEGRPGKGMPALSVKTALAHAAERGLPLRARVQPGVIEPWFSSDDAATLARSANERVVPINIRPDDPATTKQPVPVIIPVAQQMGWLRTNSDGPSLTVEVDAEAVRRDLAGLLPNAGTPAIEGSFTVSNGTPVFVPGKPGSACCAEAGVGIVRGAVDSALSSPTPVTATTDPFLVPLRELLPQLDTVKAYALGINEEVSTFTTYHPGGQPRVKNIHRISDLVRGQVIKPGEKFSLNTFVGPRTVEKGFVSDHVIEDGKFAEAVGGGISQFATTTFNAAFFAGLEFGEYQSHSIYIERYPYGREATISFPHPDLQIKNVTPFGVLIWPEYTDTSLTLKFYSTRSVTAEQTGQSTSQSGQCTAVRTERTRRYLDGRNAVDSVKALYQPAEGVRC